MSNISLKELFSKAMIEVSDPSDIPREKLASLLNKYSFAVIRGVIDSEIIREAKKNLEKTYNPDNDSPATGEHPSDIMNNFQKLSIGGAEHSGVYRPRCMRTFYNPIWAEDIYGLRKASFSEPNLASIFCG